MRERRWPGSRQWAGFLCGLRASSWPHSRCDEHLPLRDAGLDFKNGLYLRPDVLLSSMRARSRGVPLPAAVIDQQECVDVARFGLPSSSPSRSAPPRSGPDAAARRASLTHPRLRPTAAAMARSTTAAMARSMMAGVPPRNPRRIRLATRRQPRLASASIQPACASERRRVTRPSAYAAPDPETRGHGACLRRRAIRLRRSTRPAQTSTTRLLMSTRVAPMAKAMTEGTTECESPRVREASSKSPRSARSPAPPRAPGLARPAGAALLQHAPQSGPPSWPSPSVPPSEASGPASGAGGLLQVTGLHIPPWHDTVTLDAVQKAPP